ncbi:MAG: SDR family NAD(P)-dependent oxidoreductase [Planctomycetota bacterium]
MPIDLSGKPIFIAGASSGIGAATARACAAAGMPVALAARRTHKLEEVAESCQTHGITTTAIECDVTDPDACEHAIAEAEAKLGPLHAAFANAGFGQEDTLLDMPDADVRAMFETNFFGTLNILRPAAERMKRRNSGHLLICASCLSVLPTPWYSIYSATKAAQHHIGRALDVELRDHGVRCSTVHPVGTKTEFFDEMKARQGSLTIAGSSESFMQTPDTVARAIVRCLKKPRPEVWTSPIAAIGLKAAALMPGLTGRVIRRSIQKRLRERDADQSRDSSTTA